MVGFDFVRFGGTIIGDFDLVNPTKETNADHCMETATEEFAAFRGENQTMIYKDGGVCGAYDSDIFRLGVCARPCSAYGVVGDKCCALWLGAMLCRLARKD